MMVVQIGKYSDTKRVMDIRQRIRSVMEHPLSGGDYPAQIDDQYMSEPLPVRKARALALKLSHVPTDLWEGQLLAGSTTLEHPRIHAEGGFPNYTTEAERAEAAKRRRGLIGGSPHSVFGHLIPDYPRLLEKGLRGIIAEAEAERGNAQTPEENAFLDSVVIAVEAVIDYAARLAARCEADANAQDDVLRAAELRQMAANLRQAPSEPPQTFWQAIQSVWLLHMISRCTLNRNALGRFDQYMRPFLSADLESGRIDLDEAAELVDCFCLKFNECGRTTDVQRAEARKPEPNPLEFSRSGNIAATYIDLTQGTRKYTSSQLNFQNDQVDATDHWWQNIVIGGLTPDGVDGTNPVTFMVLDSHHRNQMSNPIPNVRLSSLSPDELVHYTCEVLKNGGGVPVMFNDEEVIPALERIGIPTPDARDYANDGCFEIIIPYRTNFMLQRISLMLCLEWALNHGRSRLDGLQQAPDTGDPRSFSSYDEVWQAFLTQLDTMVGGVVHHVVENLNDYHSVAPVPLLSALIDGAIGARRDITEGGAKYRIYSLFAESAAHAIDSLTAIKTVIFEGKQASMSDLCDALDANFEGYPALRSKLIAAPKYGNDNDQADSVGRDVIDAFTATVARHVEAHQSSIKFPCGVGTFSWYIGIGKGLAASPDGRLSGEPVPSNFSPALGRDMEGIPSVILSYAKMHNCNLPAGSPLDLRLARRLVEGDEGTARMAGLLRSFVSTGGTIMTLTVVDTEELRAAQREPEKYESLRVRMGGWCAYFTMLGREQQDHHIRRQETRS